MAIVTIKLSNKFPSENWSQRSLSDSNVGYTALETRILKTMIKTFKSLEEMESYYNYKTDMYEFIENGNLISIYLSFDLKTTSGINAMNIMAHNIETSEINASNIMARDIYTLDINANNITANNIYARNISVFVFHNGNNNILFLFYKITYFI